MNTTNLEQRINGISKSYSKIQKIGMYVVLSSIIGCNIGKQEDTGDWSCDNPLTWYADVDGDGYGNPYSTTLACLQPSNYVADNTDCNDSQILANPSELEICDYIDNNCDGVIDEGLTTTYYLDSDADGYGDLSSTIEACGLLKGYSSLATDCNDNDPSVKPGATEIYCDGIDQNCDGLDSGTEECDYVDNDCDGLVDEGVTRTYYADSDGDRYGDPDVTVQDCSVPSGYSSLNTDCDDTNSSVNPMATEICNDGLDNDCDDTDNGCSLSGEIYLSLADAKLIGETTDDYAGQSVSGAGDVNADGYYDILIGANGYGGTVHRGGAAAYIVHGPVTGNLDLSLADAKFITEGVNDHTGCSVSGAGDVNADGYDDVLIGAWAEDSGGNYAGAAYLVLGSVTGDLSLSLADAKLIGENSGDYAGQSVSGAGDVNNDGFDDILIGAPYEDTGGSGSGATYLLFGPVTGDLSLLLADAKLIGEGYCGDYSGASVSGAGDVNADGLDDILIGAYGQYSSAREAGAAYLVLGSVTGDLSLSLADAKFLGEALEDHAGQSVSGAGDVNADGYNDILIGAPQEDSGGSGTGAAYLVFGPVTGDLSLSLADAKIVGETAGDYAGDKVSGAGDMNADGYYDLLIGASYEDSGGDRAGAVYLVYGSVRGHVNLSSADVKFIGEASEDYAGTVSRVGDVNADGLDDILMGVSHNNSGGDDSGAVYLLLGRGL